MIDMETYKKGDRKKLFTLFAVLLVFVFSTIIIEVSLAEENRTPSTLSNYTSTNYYPQSLLTSPAAVSSNATYSITTENTTRGDVSANIYGSNTKLCSSKPTGQYCEDWRSSCNEVSSILSGNTFWIYHEVYDIFHSNGWNFYEKADATDPDGNDICWSSNCQDDAKSPDYSGPCTNCAYVCTAWQYWDIKTVGKWNFDYLLHDNIDNRESTLNKDVLITCNSNSQCKSSQQCKNQACVSCSVRSDGGWASSSSSACNGNIVTNHRFTNDGPSDLNYDVVYTLYDPSSVQIATKTETGKSLSAGSGTVLQSSFSPPAGGWQKPGTYKVTAKFIGKCSTDVVKENSATVNVPTAPCPNCNPASVSAWVSQDNLCRENIITHHKFENKGDVKVPYDVNFYLYDSQGRVVSTTSSAGQLSVGYQTTWKVTWPPASSGWKSGTYTSKAELIGKCWDGNKVVSISTSPSMPTSCDAPPPSTCNGIINIDAKESNGRVIPSSKVYLNDNYHGDTDGSGKRTVSTSDSACGKSHNVKVYCSDGKYCSSQSATIDWNGDDDALSFTCDVCVTKPSLDISISGSSSFYRGNAIKLEIETKSGGSSVSNSYVRVYDPFYGNYWDGYTSSNGKITHNSIASNTGTYTFQISANKDGYNHGSKSFSVTVTDFNGKILVGVNDLEGNPLQNAKVYLDSKLDGVTDSSGKRTVVASKGDHTVDTYCSNGNVCGSKNILVSGIESARFNCECNPKGELIVTTDNEQKFPVSNVLIFLDGRYKGLTSPVGHFKITGLNYGSHEIGYSINMSKDGQFERKGGSITANINKPFNELNIKLNSSTLSTQTLTNFGSYATIAGEKNFTGQIAPLVIAYIAITVGSIAWDAYDLCACVTGEDGLNAITSCGTYLNSCATEFTNFRGCVFNKFGSEVNDACWTETAFLASNFIPGAVFEKTGAKFAFHGGKALRYFPEISKIIDKVEGFFKVAKNKLDGLFKWLDEVGKAIFKATKGVAKLIKEIAEKKLDDISRKVDGLLKNIKVSDLPQSIFRHPKGAPRTSEIMGWLVERSADEHISIIKQELEKLGSNVGIVKGVTDNIWKYTPQLVAKYTDRGGIQITNKITKLPVAEIDRIIIVDGRTIIYELSHHGFDAGKILNRVNTLNKLTGETVEVFILSSSKQIAKESAKEASEKLSKDGIEVAYDSLKQSDEFEETARRLNDLSQ